jgi:hypothetical protein
MILGILLLFGFIFIMVLAFSSSTKETQVRRVDPRTGAETLEIHSSTSASAGQMAARVVMGIIGALVGLCILLFFLGTLMPI